MRADIVNLRRARKARDRAARSAQAAANRVAFGRTRAEKQADDVTRNRAARTLDGARCETGLVSDPSDATTKDARG